MENSQMKKKEILKGKKNSVVKLLHQKKNVFLAAQKNNTNKQAVQQNKLNWSPVVTMWQIRGIPYRNVVVALLVSSDFWKNSSRTYSR